MGVSCTSAGDEPVLVRVPGKIVVAQHALEVVDYVRPRGCEVSGDDFVSADNGFEGQPEGHPELASGMIRSTPTDIARFVSAIAAGGVLDGTRSLRAETVEEMLRPQLDPALPACEDGRVVPGNQALLWMHLPFAGDDYVGRYGGTYGFYTAGYFRVRDRLVVSVLMNRLEPEAMNVIEAHILQHWP